jgi:hypothetical protein
MGWQLSDSRPSDHPKLRSPRRVGPQLYLGVHAGDFTSTDALSRHEEQRLRR